MTKTFRFLLIALVAAAFFSCGRELIKDEEFKISTNLNENANKEPGFKTLSSYTGENYSTLEQATKKEIEKEYEIVKSSADLKPENKEK